MTNIPERLGLATRLAVLGVLPLAMSGCGLDTVFVDPPGVERGHGGLLIEGDPYVELGIYHEQLYEPFGAEAECPIVFGLQGGTWTHPAIRIQGIAPQAVVDCSLTAIVDDELVGTAKALSQFFITPDSLFEVHSYPVPIVHTDPEKGPGIEDLFNQNAVLKCTVSDDEDRQSEAVATVKLIEG
ncbi:MAG: hypothetical protein VB934_11390 [Polyangiaceae bacterium]